MSTNMVRNAERPVSEKQDLVPEILRRLDTIRNVTNRNPSRRPVNELVSTILSQHTSDSNTSRAFKSLRKRFPTWTEVIDAPVEEVVDAIRSGGLARQKAPRIQAALEQVVDRDSKQPNAKLMSQLEPLPADDALKWLTSFNGVGPKTAACVLLFAVGKPVVPVDTHVHRVSRRLGLIEMKTSADKAHQELLELVPSGEAYRFHIHLIRHGRATCKARFPRCGSCILRDICDYGRFEYREYEIA
jgi:endonuclease III